MAPRRDCAANRWFPRACGRGCGAACSARPHRSGRSRRSRCMFEPARLLDRIQSRQARTGVVGLGYVGLPLAVELARSGFRTTGIDLDARKVSAIRRGESYIPDVSSADVADHTARGRLSATTDFAVAAELDTINICVPTPLRKTKDPDMSYI